MVDRAATTDERATLSVGELIVWVAAMASMSGLVAESVRRAKVEPGTGLVDGLLVLYIVYISLSVRGFWKSPRSVIPTTMLIGGVLWTLSLQLLDRVPGLVAALSLIVVPFATALAIRWIFPGLLDPDDVPEGSPGPSTVHKLLSRNKGLGRRTALGKLSPGPHPEWFQPPSWPSK